MDIIPDTGPYRTFGRNCKEYCNYAYLLPWLLDLIAMVMTNFDCKLPPPKPNVNVNKYHH